VSLKLNAMFLRAYNPCTRSEPLQDHLVSDFNTDTSFLDSLVQPGRHKLKSFATKKMNSVRYL